MVNHSTLEAILGERPFAYVPRSVALDSTLPDGAIVLYATCAALGDEEGAARNSHGELANMIGVTRRSILLWTKELERVEGVEIDRGRGKIGYVDLGEDRRALIAAADFGRVPMLAWHATRMWTMPMRRAWVAIWAYCGKGRGCFVGVETLAGKCGRSPRAMQNTLRHLVFAKLLRITYHRRRSSDLLPFDGERFVDPKERQPAKQTAYLKSNLRSRTSQPAKQNVITCEAERIEPVKQTSPYLEREHEPIKKGNTSPRCAEARPADSESLTQREFEDHKQSELRRIRRAKT